jgi:hypothetical protein
MKVITEGGWYMADAIRARIRDEFELLVEPPAQYRELRFVCRLRLRNRFGRHAADR